MDEEPSLYSEEAELFLKEYLLQVRKIIGRAFTPSELSLVNFAMQGYFAALRAEANQEMLVSQLNSSDIPLETVAFDPNCQP